MFDVWEHGPRAKGKRLRIQLVHNYYQQPGGEDMVVANEMRLLNERGHKVGLYSVENHDIVGFAKKLKTFVDLPYSDGARDRFRAHLERQKPDLVHVHNFFPLLTTSIYDACQDLGIPVVQTLHNYRITCAGAFLSRDGKPCDKCVEGSPYWGLVHRCYRESLPGSLGLARMIQSNRKRGTWQTKVDRFIALTECARLIYIRAGLPAERISVKPNFAPDRGHPEARNRKGALFVGRLSAEKGAREMIEAWQKIDYPLRIVGDGPLMAELKAIAPGNVTFAGRLGHGKIMEEMQSAAFLAMPSTNVEGFPMVLAEAFAAGLPAVVFDTGAMREIVEEGVTGRKAPLGDVSAYRSAIESMVADSARCAAMGREARRIFMEKYTPGANYKILMDIYRRCLAAKEPVAMENTVTRHAAE